MGEELSNELIKERIDNLRKDTDELKGEAKKFIIQKEKFESLEKNADDLQKEANKFSVFKSKIESYLKVIFILALIFGVGGAFGYNIISEVGGEINTLKVEKENLKLEIKKIKDKAFKELEAAAKEHQDTFANQVAQSSTQFAKLMAKQTPPNTVRVNSEGSSNNPNSRVFAIETKYIRIGAGDGQPEDAKMASENRNAAKIHNILFDKIPADAKIISAWYEPFHFFFYWNVFSAIDVQVQDNKIKLYLAGWERNSEYFASGWMMIKISVLYVTK